MINWERAKVSVVFGSAIGLLFSGITGNRVESLGYPLMDRSGIIAYLIVLFLSFMIYFIIATGIVYLSMSSPRVRL